MHSTCHSCFLSPPAPTWTFPFLLGSHLLSDSSTPISIQVYPGLCTRLLWQLRLREACVLLLHHNKTGHLQQMKLVCETQRFICLPQGDKKGTAMTSFLFIFSPPWFQKSNFLMSACCILFFCPKVKNIVKGKGATYFVYWPRVKRWKLLLADIYFIKIGPNEVCVSHTLLSVSLYGLYAITEISCNTVNLQ